MAKANSYTSKGVAGVAVTLPKEFGDKAESLALLAQAIRVYKSASHPGNAFVKTRAEVAYTKKKLYKQKHTGNARHGAKSAPIFVGGGVTHGPRGIHKELTLPKKMKKKALSLALSVKAKKGQIVVATGLDKITKTKEAQTFLQKVFSKETAGKEVRTTIVLSDTNKTSRLSFRNIDSVFVETYRNLNANNVLYGGLIIMDKEVFDKPVTKLSTAAKTEKVKKVEKVKK